MSGRISERYPAITEAAREIAFDNGGINRFRPIEQQSYELERFLKGRSADELDPVEAWLAGLTPEEMRTVAVGGRDEPETIALMASAPPFTDALLDAYFDEVC